MLFPWISVVKKNRSALGREKRAKSDRVDVILAEQVKGILQNADQKLILMVRG